MKLYFRLVPLVAVCWVLTLASGPTAQGATATCPIAASQNDTSQDSGSPGDMTGYAAWTMFWPYTNNTVMSYWRWPISIPRTATITSAYIQVMASDKFPGDNNPSTVRLELIDSDNCPAFNIAPAYQMTTTTSHIDFSVASVWVTGTRYQSGNIAALVQEFIGRPGYNYGQAIGLRASNVSGLWKRTYQYDYGDNTSGAILVINYTGGEAILDLWMADPEVRLGQKVYCQIVDASAAVDRIRGVLDGQVFYEKVGNLLPEEVVTTNYRSLAAGQHTLTIQILDAAGTTVRGSASRTWTKLHDGIGACGIDENNAVCRYGVPFFPVTSWGGASTEELTIWGSKWNTLFGQDWSRERSVAGFGSFLAFAQTANMPVIGPAMGNYYPGGHTTSSWEDPPGSGNQVYAQQVDIAALSNYVNTLKDQPALMMWAWSDEPDLGGPTQYIPATEVRRWTDTCHQLDTQHPHIVNLSGSGFGQVPQPNWHQARAQNYCFLYNDQRNATMGTTTFPFAKKTVVVDMLGMDLYPYEFATYYSWLNLENWCWAIDNLINWNYRLIPCFTWIETTDILAANDPRLNYPWSPGPTATQLKNLIWLAIIHNCKGLGLFYYFTPTPPENLAALQTAMTWITDLTPAILGPEEVSTAVTCMVPGGSRVDIMTREHAAKLYIFSASTKSTATTARFNVAGLTAGQFIQVYGEARAITTQNGYFDDTFDPLGVHIYVVGAGAGTPGVPKPELCSIAATTPLWADGVQQSAITITVHDGYDAPVVGELAGNIVVSVTGAGNTLIQPIAPTDANGQTVAYLSTTAAGVKVASVAIRGAALTDVAQIECVALPMILSYSGVDLTQVTPGTTTGGTMTITCRDIIGSRDLWTLDIFRWIAATQLDNPQVRFTKFDDLTDAGSFNYAVAGGNGLFLAHRPATYGLDINSYTELHKGADYFEFSLTEHATGYDIVTVYRINPSTPLGTRFTATRTLTNTSGVTLVPPGVMSSSLILNDGDFNPRLATGQLSGYVYGGSVQHHQALPGPLDALWLMTDNLDRAHNPAFSAAGTLWVQATIMDNDRTRGLGLAAGRTFALTTEIVGYYPAASVGAIVFDPRTDYLDGIHCNATPAEWLGSTRANHAAGISTGSTATKHFNLDFNIQSAGLFDAGFAFAPGQDWVYQNTATTTGDRHRSLLSVAILGDNYGNTSYTVTVAKTGGAGQVAIQDGSGPLEKVLIGGRRTDGVAGTGPCQLHVTVAGNQGGLAEADLTLTVRALGDIDGLGGISGQDKLLMNKRLNGLIPDGREYDLDGLGGASGQDKLILNKLLNGIAIP